MTITPGSRYERAEHYFTNCHTYNEWGFPVLEGESGMESLQIKVNSRDTLYLLSPGMQTRPMEYFAKESENMPWQAHKYLKDPKRWWEVAAANPEIWYPLDMDPGDYMRMPT
jgi:aminoglycoside phosphotransferase